MGRYARLFGAQADGETAVAAASEPYRLLLVDDEPNVLKALARVFQRERYEIRTADGAEAALVLLRHEPFHVILADYLMPGMSGGELLRRARELAPGTIRIMLTGHADVAAVMGAVEEGAVYRFILKPWNDDDLRVTVALALERWELMRRNRELQAQADRRARELEIVGKLAATNRSQLAIMLHKRGLLTDRQLQHLHRLRGERREPVLRLLLDQGWVSETRIREILRRDFLIDEVALAEMRPDPAAVGLLPPGLCRRHWVVPLRVEGRRLLVAVADPLDEGLLDELRFTTGLDVRAAMAPVADIEAKLDDLHGADHGTRFEELETLFVGGDPFESVEVVIEEDEDAALGELLRGTDEPPAVRLVNAIIIEAVRLGVSDIHIQPRAKSVVVRYRMDGVLHDKIHIPHHLHLPLVSRIKVMAELDIAERRRPQDGRITVKTPLRIVDLRISTLPTIGGEKVVMRVLDRNASVQDVRELGLAPADLKRVLSMIARPQGIVLATGPTGSGKTTTLYSLLKHDADPGKNYVTIEDPVEFYLDMAGQVHVRERIGLTFAKVLRAILRQDPDVILLGEIRDFETAEVAFHAALTGHLVLSTLHTNSAVGAIARLLDLGLKPYVVASALEGIVAQRLVRRVCEDCRRRVDRTDAGTLERLGLVFDLEGAPTWRGEGCARCGGTGYRGRVGLYEVLVADDALRELIAAGGSVMEIQGLAWRQGMGTLLEDARAKVLTGLTTPEEVLRVLGPQCVA